MKVRLKHFGVIQYCEGRSLKRQAPASKDAVLNVILESFTSLQTGVVVECGIDLRTHFLEKIQYLLRIQNL